MMRINLLAGLMVVFLLASCKKDSKLVEKNIQKGTWKVTRYVDDGNDETLDFNNYIFDFQDGSVTVTNGSQTYTGTFSTGNDDSHSKLILNFSGDASLIEISDDWHIINQSNSKIELEDVSGGNGGTDYLDFEKI